MEETEKTASIIQIIQEMIKKGESEEKIISTLKDLGITEEQAKRLLLLGEADTFALLESEITKIILNEIEKEKPILNELIEEKTIVATKKTEKFLSEKNEKNFSELKENIKKMQEKFETDIEQRIKKIMELSEKTKDELLDLNNRTKKVELDLDELKVSGLGKRNKFVSMLLILFGIIFSIASLYIFFSSFQEILSIDILIETVVFALIAIVLFFVSTIV
jgi:SMC interacting uncharacterized protein involved in chromosome segregation